MDREDSKQAISAATSGMLQTTIGDLICAICEAAEEAAIADEDVPSITKIVLGGLLMNNTTRLS
ncbi:MAG: hypothetical protein KDD44_01320 [Bdellovibrionales bacterium]|nr:hypothetical protein [Bdellovibrionales bacterium]